jgi:hypothetical protein
VIVIEGTRQQSCGKLSLVSLYLVKSYWRHILEAFEVVLKFEAGIWGDVGEFFAYCREARICARVDGSGLTIVLYRWLLVASLLIH